MRGWMMFLVIWFLFSTIPAGQVSSAATEKRTLQLPPLPKIDEQAEQIAIFLTKDGLASEELQQLLQKYSHTTLRNTFNYALKGFSAKGPAEELKRLARESVIADYSLVNHYKAADINALPNQGDNLEMIGADVVRGMFDGNHRRLTGKGVKVGVIDTGIDYRHEDLRKNYGGGQDVVDGDGDPMETTGIGGASTLHGTHVAGIIAANGRITGVAPDATILAYRALGPGGMGTTEQVIAAIEQAIKDKVDIINLSLGNNVNGPDLPLSVALNNAVDHGITAVTSSGNSGPNVWTVGSPGTAAKAISVGASTPTMKIPYIEVEGVKIRLEPLLGSVTWDLDRTYELADGGIGLPKQLRNMAGKIALIERGEITFSEKVDYAEKAGATAVIIYNNTKGPFLGNLDRSSKIPVMSISKKDGRELKKKAAQGQAYVKTYIIEEKDTLADFSSRGPVTTTWDIKPDIVAPGVAILSTIPGGYLSLQGTSMAAPHVAGACALLKQAHPKWGPVQIKAALMNYAKPLQDRNHDDYKTYEQGAGRIQLEESIAAAVLVYPASLQFGKFQLADRPHEHQAIITIENTSNAPQKITFEVPNKEPGMTWHMPMPVYLEAGEKKEVKLELEVDPQIFKKKIHDGSLTLHADGRDIGIPYLFVLEEPNYPRVMGFDFGAGDREGIYRYEVYLPGGAEEFGIALFDPDTYQFVQYLDWKRNTGKGMLQEDIPVEKLPPEGLYLSKVFARKAGQEDWIETYIQISKIIDIQH
ncbi:S8 family serine peptidase [Bacillus tuaregi]|uniref:S8 family serine peptidase n=1 Tax=Bacillus tuaregi TaxID=1816695 RepID=UPI0008F822BF|nr:S8 family serine peptidase [Bacillus tuaregi]